MQPQSAHAPRGFQRAAPGHDLARLARSSGGARPARRDQAERRVEFELAAIAKRLDGVKATVFPRPDGHAMPVISGLVSDRQWIADAMGVEPGEVLARFQDAALNPLPWQEIANAPAQEIVHREVDLARQLPCRRTTSTTAAPTSRRAC
jgi:UbiD family decarboxylase